MVRREMAKHCTYGMISGRDDESPIGSRPRKPLSSQVKSTYRVLISVAGHRPKCRRFRAFNTEYEVTTSV